MPVRMVIALGLTIAGILAMFLVWRELDRMDRFWEEMDEWGRRGVRQDEGMPKARCCSRDRSLSYQTRSCTGWEGG